jgi:hypothetical protein
MTESENLHTLFGLEPDEPGPQPGAIDIWVDGAAHLVVVKLTTDAGAFEVAMEPHAAYQLGFQLIDRALRACCGAWQAGR